MSLLKPDLRIVVLTLVGIFCATIALMARGVALAADEVGVTLTFADRPPPDLKSFTALRAGGSAVQGVEGHCPSSKGVYT